MPPRRSGSRGLAIPKPGGVGEVDQEVGLAERVGPDPLDADLLDQVVAGRRGVERGDVRRAGEEARRAGGVAHLLLEGEGRLVGLPAGVGRLEPLGEVGADVEPAVAGAAAEPLDRAADGEVDVQRGHVERDDPGRLVGVEDHVRARLVRALDDAGDVLDLGGLEEDVADRDEQRALVDRLDDLAVVLADDDLEVGLRLVEVAHRGEVAALVDDAVPLRRRPEAGEDDGFRDRDVLVHHRRARRRADDPADLVADGHRQLPPAFAPGADATLAPGAGVLGEPLLDRRRHRAQRVVDQVRRLLEDRELGAVVEELAHARESATKRGVREGRVPGTVPGQVSLPDGFAGAGGALASPVPRIPRSKLPTPAWYHVICRGVEQRTIVLDDLDRVFWFTLLAEVERRFGWKIHVWILLDNHLHLLVETTQPELSAGMQRLNGLHAMRFNRRYNRVGHLFQGRFEARVIKDDDVPRERHHYIYENSSRVGLARLALARARLAGGAIPAPASRTMLTRDGMTDESRLSEHPVGGVERRNGAVVIHLVGELDLYNAPALRASLLALAPSSPNGSSST